MELAPQTELPAQHSCTPVSLLKRPGEAVPQANGPAPHSATLLPSMHQHFGDSITMMGMVDRRQKIVRSGILESGLWNV